MCVCVCMRMEHKNINECSHMLNMAEIMCIMCAYMRESVQNQLFPARVCLRMAWSTCSLAFPCISTRSFFGNCDFVRMCTAHVHLCNGRTHVAPTENPLHKISQRKRTKTKILAPDLRNTTTN